MRSTRQVSEPARPSPIVGIAASAGGLEALKSFFGALPSDMVATFIVVVHLDPTHESLLPELLARVTALKVSSAQDREPLEPQHIYVIPPNRYLMLDQGMIRLHEPADRRALRGTIDQFFRSLAADQGDRAIGVILSGTGTDGTLGLKAIKAEGGLVIAQAPDTASQAGMPLSAIATGMVDMILPPEKMPEAIVNYTLHVPPGGAGEAAATIEPLGLNAVVSLLRARKKHDFRGYKVGTLRRRVERRMGLQQIPTLPKYVEYLRTHATEVDQLVKDLLITVTSFFRDPQAFDDLSARVLTPLVRANADTPIRIWVAGCATGEEAYSIAMLLAERLEEVQSHRVVQIFATDVDEDALQVARAAVYPESIALDITPPRLQRFFSREDHRYRVTKTIRDMVTFAKQNVISDPPFSKLDLVSCRNLLIYLEPDVQRVVLTMFHFALNPGGHLFLGSAENVGHLDELFTPRSARWRIYERLGTARAPRVAIPYELPHATLAATRAVPAPSAADAAVRELLDRFAPAAVVVGQSGQMVHSFGPVDRYLRLPSGEPTLEVVALVRPSLRPAVRAALRTAMKTHRESAVDVAPPGRRRTRSRLTILAMPLKGPARGNGQVLLMFHEQPARPAVPVPRVPARQRDAVRVLEADLRAAKKEQQSLVEQLESSNEELKAANEEAISMNEELQSTNEELVSSKEELQSLNEELSTVNAQLREKVEELSTTNDDLTNLFAATDIATVFVDAEFRVARFTPAASRLLNLIPGDVGRPIAHLAHNLVDFDLSREADVVRRTATSVEKAVEGKDGRHYIVRILPYRREGKTPPGVVVSFIDVTTVATTEEALRRNRAYVQAVAALSRQALAGPPLDDLMTSCTRTLAETLGADFAELLAIDMTAGTLHLRAGAGPLPAPASPMPISGAPEGDVVSAAKTMTFSGLQEDARFAQWWLREPRVEAGIGALVRREGRPWGVLAAFTTTRREFSPDELKFVEAVANTLGTALSPPRGGEALALP